MSSGAGHTKGLTHGLHVPPTPPHFSGTMEMPTSHHLHRGSVRLSECLPGNSKQPRRRASGKGAELHSCWAEHQIPSKSSLSSFK